MIKRFLIALVLVVLICGGLVGFNLFRAKMIGEFFANMQPPPVAVSAMKVEPVKWTPQIEAIGTLWAAQGVDVAVEIGGRIRAIEFTANQRVEQGELLVQIDDAVERAELQSAHAAVERDRAALARAEQLRKRGVSAEAQLEEAQTNFASSESALARLQAVLDQKAIEAPFDGIIGIPRVDVGQYVQPGDVIATLQQLDTMKVDFTVPEQRLYDLKLGQAAVFGLTEAEFPYSGEIIGIDPKIDPQTRMIAVRAKVDNPDGELRPGQFTRVRIELPAKDDVISVPQTAVVTSLYGDYVYVVEAQPKQPAPEGGEQPAQGEGETAAEGQPANAPAAGGNGPALVAKQVFVQIGPRQGNMIQIAKGLEAGQTVVTSGQNKLTNNAPVTINNAADPAAVALGEGNGRT
jgi:membrane fusion protein (multidrug efflux system)